MIKSVTVTVPSTRAVKKIYVIPKEGGGFEEESSIKRLYRHKKGQEQIPGRIAVHTYETQRQYDFIHLQLREHHPDEFDKLRSGTFTTNPTPVGLMIYMVITRNDTGDNVFGVQSKALKYANKLIRGRITEAKDLWNEFIAGYLSEGVVAVELDEHDRQEFLAQVAEIDSIKQLPLTVDETKEVGLPCLHFDGSLSSTVDLHH